IGPGRLRRRGSLRGDVEGVERLAPAHEEPVALGAAERDVRADLGEPDAPDELAFRRPDGHAAVAKPAAAGVTVAGDPHVALDVAARAVRAALDAVDHEIAEELLVRQLVVGADIEHVHVALATLVLVAGAAARADDVELLVVGREAEPVRVWELS